MRELPRGASGRGQTHKLRNGRSTLTVEAQAKEPIPIQRKPVEAKRTAFEIPEIKISEANVNIGPREGSSLILHNWSEKAIRMIVNKQERKPTGGREIRKPDEEFKAAKYLDAKGHDCIKAAAFKAAIVSAARFSGGEATMTFLRGALYIPGDLLRLKFKKCVMRRDMVRVNMGGADVRYRPEYFDWSLTLPIRYNTNIISPAQILTLLNLAGFHIGVGEWRPEKNGNFGMFEVLP